MHWMLVLTPALTQGLMMYAYLISVYVYPSLCFGTQRKDEKQLTRTLEAHSRGRYENAQRAHRSATEIL